MPELNGKTLRDAFISGANNIANQRAAVDALNVFPVPDGDTGTNMTMTTANAKREVERLVDDSSVGEVAKVEASGLLRGARGNSGVILSLLFRGFSKGLKDKTTATAADIVSALETGVEAAYKAVMKPTEGTILTVARESTEHVRSILGDSTDVLSLWQELIKAAKASLERTPELLPVLKKAGVVDAGGRGLIAIFEGMESVFRGDGIVLPLEKKEKAPEEEGPTAEKTDRTYRAEFIVIKKDRSLSASELRAKLEAMGDDCLVMDEETSFKCRIHTDEPGNVLQAGLEFGALTDIKIENLKEGHNERRSAENEELTRGYAYAPVDPSREYGFVSVAAGEGIHSLFAELGVNQIVSGGQTMNPSTEDILSAVHATPAKTVFVLPNNKNIIMAAEQAVHLADRTVVVIPTVTIPQGISAMMAFDESASAEENEIAMKEAAENVGTAQLTFAARDSDFDGKKIKKGEILALENGRVSFADNDLAKAAVRVTKNLLRKDADKIVSFINLFYGADITEEKANEVCEYMKEKLPKDIEISAIYGGQPVYYFIISVE